jgi:hypothetical protein
MPNYIYGCGPFQDIRPGILVFWAFGRGYEPLLTLGHSFYAKYYGNLNFNI